MEQAEAETETGAEGDSGQEAEQSKPKAKPGRKKKSVSQVDDLFGGMYNEENLPEAEPEEEEAPEGGEEKATEAGEVRPETGTAEAEATEPEAETVEKTEPEPESGVEETGGAGEDIPAGEVIANMNVHELRKLARSLDSFPIKGRDISKANRGTLIDYFNGLR